MDLCEAINTVFCNIWLALMIAVRILLTFYGGRAIYNDDQDKFVCNSQNTGCNIECYSAMAPLGLGYMRFLHFHSMVTVAIMFPILVHVIRADKSKRVPMMSRGLYVFQMLVRAMLEALYLYALYTMYGLEVKPHHVCSSKACREPVRCVVSRPYEKTYFMRTMFAVSSICLACTVLTLYQGFRCLRRACNRPRPLIPEKVPLAELRE